MYYFKTFLLVVSLLSNQICRPLAACQSDVFATLRAQDVVTLSEETPAHQGDGALPTVEAVMVPLTLFKGDVLTSTQTTDWGGAGGTLLSVQVAETVEAVCKVITGGEPLA